MRNMLLLVGFVLQGGEHGLGRFLHGGDFFHPVGQFLGQFGLFLQGLLVRGFFGFQAVEEGAGK